MNIKILWSQKLWHSDFYRVKNKKTKKMQLLSFWQGWQAAQPNITQTDFSKESQWNCKCSSSKRCKENDSMRNAAPFSTSTRFQQQLRQPDTPSPCDQTHSSSLLKTHSRKFFSTSEIQWAMYFRTQYIPCTMRSYKTTHTMLLYVLIHITVYTFCNWDYFPVYCCFFYVYLGGGGGSAEDFFFFFIVTSHLLFWT